MQNVVEYVIKKYAGRKNRYGVDSVKHSLKVGKRLEGWLKTVRLNVPEGKKELICSVGYFHDALHDEVASFDELKKDLDFGSLDGYIELFFSILERDNKKITERDYYERLKNSKLAILCKTADLIDKVDEIPRYYAGQKSFPQMIKELRDVLIPVLREYSEDENWGQAFTRARDDAEKTVAYVLYQMDEILGDLGK